MGFLLPEWEMEWILVNNPALLDPGSEILNLEVVAQQYDLPRSGGYVDILCRFPEGLLAVELKNEFVDDSSVITHQLNKYLADLLHYSNNSEEVRCLLVSTHGFSRQVQELATARSVRLQTISVENLLEQAWRLNTSADTLSSAKARLLQRRVGLKTLDKAKELVCGRPDARYQRDVASIDHFISSGKHDAYGLRQLARGLKEVSRRAPIMAHKVFDEDDGNTLSGEEEKWFWFFYSVLDRRANAATFVKAKEALERCRLFLPQELVRLVETTSNADAVDRVFRILRDSEFPLAADSIRRDQAMPSSIVDAAMYLSRFEFSMDNMLEYFTQALSRSEDLADTIMAHLRKHVYGVGPRIAAQIVRGLCLKSGWKVTMSSPVHLEQCGFNETFAGPGRLGLVSSPQSYRRELKRFADSYLGGNCGVISHALWFIRKRFCLRPKRCDECPVAGFCNYTRSMLLRSYDRKMLGAQPSLFSRMEEAVPT